MNKIVRRTNLQIIKDDLEDLVIAPKEVNILSYKDIFSRVKNIEQFKEVMNTLMGFVTHCIYILEGDNPPPRERYELTIKAKQMCEVIKTKNKMKITGLSTRYKNQIHNFLVEDGNYFLKIKKKELARLEEESLNDYSDDEVKELVFKKKKFKALYNILRRNIDLSKQMDKALSRLWLVYLNKQISRDKTNTYLKNLKTQPFYATHFFDYNWVEKLDIDLQIRFYKEFSFTKVGDEIIVTWEGFKSTAIPSLKIDKDNPSFIEEEKLLLQQSELSDNAFEFKLSEIEEEFSEVTTPSNIGTFK